MCNFSINFNGNVEALVGKAKNAITGAGGSFNGDIRSGSFGIKTFLGEVVGLYEISNQQLNIEISKKPMLVPCSEIENQLRKYLG